jgi:hypothetical protein
MIYANIKPLHKEKVSIHLLCRLLAISLGGLLVLLFLLLEQVQDGVGGSSYEHIGSSLLPSLSYEHFIITIITIITII